MELVRSDADKEYVGCAFCMEVSGLGVDLTRMRLDMATTSPGRRGGEDLRGLLDFDLTGRGMASRGVGPRMARRVFIPKVMDESLTLSSNTLEASS